MAFDIIDCDSSWYIARQGDAKERSKEKFCSGLSFTHRAPKFESKSSNLAGETNVR